MSLTCRRFKRATQIYTTSHDLLVVDNDLPGLSGLELVRRKTTHHRRTPIMAQI
jgi:CheY-like chemotaxis protein